MSLANTILRSLRSYGPLALLLAACLTAERACAQFGAVQQQVGGVSIDAQGIVSNVRPDELNTLRRERERAFQAAPGDMQAMALRKVSLKALESAIADKRDNNQPIPDEMRYLAGMQRIQYIFVYPEQHDIVIAGPGEGWKLNAHGEPVGVTTNRPVLLLDDLVVALRSTEATQRTGINCSIDPSVQGLARLQAFYRSVGPVGDDPSRVMAAVEEVLGQQAITISGVPANSHFARVMLAADYRMKRLAMAFEEPPIAGLPSFLQVMQMASRTPTSMLPRWWLAPKYDALVRDADGLAWELRTASVQAMTEEEVVNASGSKQKAARPNPLAKQWADNMTARYDELSAVDTIFGQLRNCIDMAVLAALISKEQLAAKADFSMALLLNPEMPVESYHAPKSVDSKASVLQRGTDWIISASGGVQIIPWQPFEKPVTKAELSATRAKAVGPGNRWWWN